MKKKKKAKVKKEKLVIGVATHAHWVIDFDVHFNHVYTLMNWAKHYDIQLLGQKGLMAADARENVCGVAIEQGCTHVLFLDADHVIPLSMLKNLLESKNEAMVSGIVVRRGSPFNQVAYGKRDKEGTYVEIHLPLDGKIYEVGACAFGCTLINIAKLQKLEKPWFRDTCEAVGDAAKRNIRSDINLCDMFRANGEKVWIDTRVLIGHTGQYVVAYPQNAKCLRSIEGIYRDSVLLREGMVGEYALPAGRVL